jgi:AP-3 complex subunit beta
MLKVELVLSMDPSQLPSLLPILTSLISSHATSAHAALSAGAAARALLTIAPTRLDILHPHFRRLARLLIDADAWGQVDLLEMLVRYSRRMLSKPSEDGEDMDPDLKLLLDSAEPIFMSRNPAVRTERPIRFRITD